MHPETSPEPRRRWWSWALVVHAFVVLALVVAPFVLGPEPSGAVMGLYSLLDLVLGTPWWLVIGFLYLLPLPSHPVAEAVVFSLPLLINLGVHALVLRFVRARKRRAAEADGVGTSARYRRPGFTFAVGSVAGALTWGAWLGWDRTPSYDVVTGTVQTPYVTLQVLGCAITVGVVTAILAARWHPVAAAVGVSVGFWLVWTVDAASQDDSGLFAVGAMMMAVGLPAATAVAAGIGAGVRLAIDARRAGNPRSNA